MLTDMNIVRISNVILKVKVKLQILSLSCGEATPLVFALLSVKVPSHPFHLELKKPFWTKAFKITTISPGAQTQLFRPFLTLDALLAGPSSCNAATSRMSYT